MSNIWVAAADGDLARVQLVEQDSLSANLADDYTYTPMHSAASYGHITVLQYLISHGGDVNIADSDGDTPLYTVENIETARFLVEHGAVVNRQNNDGISPIEHLAEDFGDVARYLQSVSASPVALGQEEGPSQHQQNIVTEQLTSELMASVEDVMERAEVEGRDPEDDLRRVVSRAVFEGVAAGYGMTTTREVDSRAKLE